MAAPSDAFRITLSSSAGGGAPLLFEEQATILADDHDRPLDPRAIRPDRPVGFGHEASFIDQKIERESLPLYEGLVTGCVVRVHTEDLGVELLKVVVGLANGGQLRRSARR